MENFEVQKGILDLALEWDTQTSFTGFTFKYCDFHVLGIFTALEGMIDILRTGSW